MEECLSECVLQDGGGAVETGPEAYPHPLCLATHYGDLSLVLTHMAI